MRKQLRSTVASAAGPYGYTISLGGSTAMAVGRLGTPHLGDSLLLMLGAVLGFALLEFIAQGSMHPEGAAPDRPLTILGNLHVPSAGGALLAVWGLLHVLHGAAGWAATGFAATTIYFVVTALQRVLSSRAT